MPLGIVKDIMVRVEMLFARSQLYTEHYRITSTAGETGHERLCDVISPVTVGKWVDTPSKNDEKFFMEISDREMSRMNYI